MYVFTFLNGKTRWKSKQFHSVGQIKSFRGPHLDRGPYVVHGCIKTLGTKKLILNQYSLGTIYMLLIVE